MYCDRILLFVSSPFCLQELLNALHERHEEWLIQRKFPVPAPVMVNKLLFANAYVDAFVLQKLKN